MSYHDHLMTMMMMNIHTHIDIYIKYIYIYVYQDYTDRGYYYCRFSRYFIYYLVL